MRFQINVDEKKGEKECLYLLEGLCDLIILESSPICYGKYCVNVLDLLVAIYGQNNNNFETGIVERGVLLISMRQYFLILRLPTSVFILIWYRKICSWLSINCNFRDVSINCNSNCFRQLHQRDYLCWLGLSRTVLLVGLVLTTMKRRRIVCECECECECEWI